MKTIAFITLLSLISGLGLKAQDSISISGYARNYTGVLTKDPGNFSIVQNTFNLNFSGQSSKIGFKVNPYLYHYFDRKMEFGLREAWLDLYAGNFDFRIGKQQIIWGKAEGVFITDVVSPKDLREFLLPDFDEIRTGVTAFKTNYRFGNSTVEAVWTPVFTPTIMPEAGSLWEPQINFPVVPAWDNSTSTITPSIENSEVFLRYSLMASAFDFELTGGYFFYDDPALHLTKQIDPMSMQLTGLTVRPEYHRVSMAGGSFSAPVGPFILRGEGAFYSGRHFQTAAPEYSDATVEKDNLHYMAGIDYSIGGFKLSTQFIQEHLLDYEEGIKNEEFDNTMTFLVKKDFLREQLWLEVFAYVGLNESDALIRPKVTYSFADGFEIISGANIFTGQTGRFGQYDENDMVFLKFKYSF